MPIQLPRKFRLLHEKSAALGKVTPVETVPVGFLVLATCPLILWLFDGTVAGIASAALVIVLFAVALVLLSIGQRNHAAYDAAEVAYRPRFPLKLLGSFLMAVVVGLLAASKLSVPGVPELLTMVAFVLSLLAFGLDPLRDKGLSTPQARRKFRNERTLRGIEMQIDALYDQVATVGDEELNARARRLFDTILGVLSAIDLETNQLERLARPVEKLQTAVNAEFARLCTAESARDLAVARHRYLTKLAAVGLALESRARRIGVRVGRDGFELQADVLFERMRRKRAA